MSLNDQLANALSLMLNSELVGKKECLVKPASSTIKEVLRVMKEYGYLKEFKEIEDGKGNYIKITLSGCINKCGVIKPRYSTKIAEIEKFEKRYLPAKDIGIIILSTPPGVMTHYDAKKKSTGGRLLAYCY